MKQQEFSQGRMGRETAFSYNTVKKCLKRIEAESSLAAAPDTGPRLRAYPGPVGTRPRLERVQRELC